jgi:hypothetical protein
MVQLASLRDVALALRSLDLPVPPPANLHALAATHRDGFLHDLTLCIRDPKASTQTHERLRRVLLCMTERVDRALQSLGIEADARQRAHLAVKAPKRFESALACAADAKDDRCGAALAWLSAELVQAAPGSDEPARVQAPSSTAAGGLTADTPMPAPRRSHPVYGSNAALCFNATDYQGKPGVMIDAAASVGPRSYDWRNAAHIWLRPVELASVFAVFRRATPQAEFNNHGPRKDKAFSLQAQNGHFFARVTAGRDFPVCAVKVVPTDAHAVSVLVLEQLLLAHPNLPPSAVMALALSVNGAAG